MQRIVIVCLILLIPALLPGQQWKTFADTSVLFTAKYPADWTTKIKEGKRVFFTSPADNPQDDFLENINISVISNPGYGTEIKIKDLFPSVTNNLKTAFTEFTEESQRFFKWNNADAAEIIYSGYNKIDTSFKVRMVQWFCFYKTRLYTMTYTSKADNTKHNATARKIMSGIVFRN
jgi:hypothetical protein